MFVGADPNIISSMFVAPLLNTAKTENYAILRLLLDAGVEVNVTCNMNSSTTETPLQCALQIGCLECAQVLIEKGANVLQVDEEGQTLMQYAVISRKPNMLELLHHRLPADFGRNDDSLALAHLLQLISVTEMGK